MLWKVRISGLIVVAAGLAVAAMSRAACAQQVNSIVRVSDEIDLDTVGNAVGQSEVVLPPEVYQKLKMLLGPRYTVQENGQSVTRYNPPKVESVLRYLGMSSTAYELLDVKGEFDDDAATINIKYKILGRSRYRQGRWVFSFQSDPEIKVEVHRADIKGNTAFVELRNKQQNVTLITRLHLNLPPGADKIEFRKKSLDLVYNAPPAQATPETQASRPDFRFEVKPQLMSAIYKLYANPKWLELWVARSVLQNDTAETFSDFHARFRLQGYSDWTPWTRCDKVYPGQTVVDGYYPVIDSKIIQLRGTTPVQVELEYIYTRPNGEKVTESETQRTKLLGINEALWSSLEGDESSSWYEFHRNTPMLMASFTSASDPVILDVVGMISKATGGAGASISDEWALKFMGTLYNLLRENIAYETTAGAFDKGIVHQHLKYGRDVLRTRSGTCVNLAILYASACEAAGLDAFIVNGPGHAFPGAKLPKSGLPVYVESTGCGGGTKESSMTFVQARESAYKTYQQWYAQGLIIDTDIRQARNEGVASPELADAGTNPLKEWGIKQPDAIDQVYLAKLLISVKGALDGAKLNYSPITGFSAVQLKFSTREGNEWTTTVQTDEIQELLIMMSRMPGVIPEQRRAAAATELGQLNTTFLHGSFELSKEGQITFRTSANLRGGTLANSMVLNDVDFHFNTMQKQLPELRKLMVVSQAEQAAQAAPTAAAKAPAPAAANSPLLGQWSSIITDQAGNKNAHGVMLNRDGTFVAITANSSGGNVQVSGHWTFKNNVLTTVNDNQQTYSGTIKFLNKDRFIYHELLSNTELTYDRLQGK